MITLLDSNSHRKLEQSLTSDLVIHKAYFESSDDGYAIMPNGAFISLVFGKYTTVHINIYLYLYSIFDYKNQYIFINLIVKLSITYNKIIIVFFFFYIFNEHLQVL